MQLLGKVGNRKMRRGSTKRNVRKMLTNVEIVEETRLWREGGGGQTTTLAHTWEGPPCCVKETDVGWKASSYSASQLLDTE